MDPSSTKTDISVVAATTTVRASTTHPEEEISSSRGLRLFSSRCHLVFSPTAVVPFYLLFLSLSRFRCSPVSPFAFLFPSYKLPRADCRPRLLSPIVSFAVTNNRFRHEMSIEFGQYVDLCYLLTDWRREREKESASHVQPEDKRE